MAIETENPQTSSLSVIQSTDSTSTTKTTTQKVESSPQSSNNTITSTTPTDSTPSALSSNNSKNGDLSYNVDYNDIDNGVQNIEDAVKDVNESLNECNKVIGDIFTESTFAGPFADYCYGTWNGLSELTVQTNTKLDASAQVLNNNSVAYAESDKNTGEKVGGI